MTACDHSTAEPAPRRRAGRSTGRILLAMVLALAVSAAAVLVLTDEPRWLRLGVVAALWAALVGAFAAARYRREVAGHTDRSEELRRVYELELEREVAARREYELEVETTTRRRVEEEVRNEVRGELDGLRTELRTLRQNLEALLGGEVLVERVALRAESTRLRSLSDQSRAARSADRALPQGRGQPSDHTAEWTPEAGRAFAADAEVLSSRIEPSDAAAGSGIASWSTGTGVPTPNGTSWQSADDRTEVLPRYRPRTERLDPEPATAEPLRPEPMRWDAGRSGPSRSEPLRSEPLRPESLQSESLRSEPLRSEPLRSEPLRSEPLRSEPLRPESLRSEPLGSESLGSESLRSEPVRHDPIRQEPMRHEPVQRDPVSHEWLRSETVRPEAVRPEAVRPEALRQESVQPEPVSREWRRSELVQHEPLRSESPPQRYEPGTRQQPPARQHPARTGSSTANLRGVEAAHTARSAFADRQDSHQQPVSAGQPTTASYSDPPWAAEPSAFEESAPLEPRRERPDPLGVDSLMDQRRQSRATEPSTPAWERFDSWAPTGQPTDPAQPDSNGKGSRRHSADTGPAASPSSSSGGRRRAAEPDPMSSGHTGGHRRAAESEPSASSGHTGGHRRAADHEAATSASSSHTGGRRRAAETTGSHASGRSVDDLLASLGDPAEPRRHRRRND